MRLRALLILGVLMFAAPAAAQSDAALSAGDQAAIRGVIQNQIAAFQRDDGAAAFGYASPAIRAMFGAPDIFMDMVRRGYPAVYRPRSFEFAALRDDAGALLQMVEIVGPDGAPVLAAYKMVRSPEGGWLIDGCFILSKPPDVA